MEQSKQKVYSRRLTLVLIWGPIVSIILTLIIFVLINTVLGSGTNVYYSSSGSSLQSFLTVLSFVSGLLASVAVVGLFTALPYGIYRLKKDTSTDTKSKIIRSENGLKFIKDTPFSSIDDLFKAVMVFNGIQILVNLYMIVPMVMVYQGLKNPDNLSMSTRNFIANFNYDFYSNGLLVLALLSGVTFLVWFNRAYRNLYYFDNKTNNTPGWVVGDFFIPIVNLVAPYKNMKELYEKTIGNHQVNLVLGWWLTLLGGTLIGRYLQLFTDDQGMTNAEIANTIGIGILGNLMDVATLIFAVVLLKKITDAQNRKAKKAHN